MAKKINPSDFKDLVVLYKSVTCEDENGMKNKTYKEIFKFKASIEDLGTKEFYIASQSNIQDTKKMITYTYRIFNEFKNDKNIYIFKANNLYFKVLLYNTIAQNRIYAVFRIKEVKKNE